MKRSDLIRLVCYLAAVAFILVLFMKVEPVYVILGAMPLGILYLCSQRKFRKTEPEGGAK